MARRSLQLSQQNLLGLLKFLNCHTKVHNLPICFAYFYNKLR